MRTMETIPIYLCAMLVALAHMTTDIYDIHAWNHGIQKLEPWRKRVSSAAGVVKGVVLGMLGHLWTDHRPLVLASAVLLCMLVLHPQHADAAVLIGVAGTTDVRELRTQREKLVADMRAVIDRADTEKRALTPEDNTKLAAMKADALRIKESIAHLEDVDAETRALVPESQRQERRPAAGDPRAKDLRAFLCADPEDRSAPTRFTLTPPTAEQRANNTLSGAAGGYSVAPDTSMYGRIISALKFFGGIEQSGATVVTTDSGADLPIATDDDTSNVGAIVAEEGSHAGGTSPTMGQVTLHAYLYSSKVLKVSWQLLQDTSFDIEGWLGGKFGMRLGRIQNTHYTTGSGINQPQGVVTAATVGRQSVTGNATSVVSDDVLRVIHSVDPAYRTPDCKFMMADATALAYELLKDGDGQYLWRNGTGLTGVPSTTLAGYGVVINNDMPALAASAKHTAFGQFSNYYIRRVRAIQIVRMNELYVENGQVGFLAFLRADGGLVDAGQHPIKLIQNSAA